MRILKVGNINLDEIRFSDPRHNRTGSQSVYVNYSPGATSRNEERITIQSPTVMIPFGVSEFKGSYYLDISVRDDVFVDFIKYMDAKVIKQAVIKSEEWFGRQLPEEEISTMFRPSIRETKPGFPPIFKAKLFMNEGEYEGDVYDMNKNLVSLGSLEKMSRIQVMVELVGIYIVPKAFGITWKISQIKIHPSKVVSGYSFKDEVDDGVQEASP